MIFRCCKYFATTNQYWHNFYLIGSLTAKPECLDQWRYRYLPFVLKPLQVIKLSLKWTMYRKLFEGESHVVFKDWKWLLITRKRDFFVSHIPVVYSQHFYLHLLFNPHSQLCSLGMILLFVFPNTGNITLLLCNTWTADHFSNWGGWLVTWNEGGGLKRLFSFINSLFFL